MFLVMCCLFVSCTKITQWISTEHGQKMKNGPRNYFLNIGVDPDRGVDSGIVID